MIDCFYFDGCGAGAGAGTGAGCALRSGLVG